MPSKFYAVAVGDSPDKLAEEVNRMADLGYYPSGLPMTVVRAVRQNPHNPDVDQSYLLYHQPLWNANGTPLEAPNA